MDACRICPATAMIRLLLATCLLTILAAAPGFGQIGSSYCFGTGCPCGNDDSSAG